MELNLEGAAVVPTREVRYLGVILDQGLTCAPRVQQALSKAKAALAAREQNRKRLATVKRAMTIRVFRAYRTVDTRGVLVIARQVPWHLVAMERKHRYEDQKKLDPSKRTTKKQRREATVRKWQEEWSQVTEGGQWTRRLLPDLRSWYARVHGELSYHLMQVLTGHGSFQHYLCRIGRAATPRCLMCQSAVADRHGKKPHFRKTAVCG